MREGACVLCAAAALDKTEMQLEERSAGTCRRTWECSVGTQGPVAPPVQPLRHSHIMVLIKHNNLGGWG